MKSNEENSPFHLSLWFPLQLLFSHLSVKANCAAVAAPVVCCLQSQESLFSSVIQRPPLSWAKSLQGDNYLMQESRAVIGRGVLGEGPVA